MPTMPTMSGNLLRYAVIAHELGHAEFGLPHPEEDPQRMVEDPENIMDGAIEITGGVIQLPEIPRLRFWQWETIHH